MLTYCFAALAGGLYVRHFMDKPIDYIPILVLAVMVFFRTIVSPVTEDIRKDTFLLQPEPIWSKLFYSLLGGSCNCALDVFFPLMIGSAAAGFSPLRGLLYLPVLMSLDFFASASGVFTDVSIPPSVGVNFKQVIQIILLYVGLIFDGVVLSYGINYNHSAAGFILAAILNILFGGMFLGLTGVWLYPCKGKAVRDKTTEPERRPVRKSYSRVALALTLMALTILAAQIGLSRTGLDPLFTLYLPIYGIGLPVFLLTVGRQREKTSLPRRSLRPREILALIPACFFVMYGGNIVGLLLQRITGVLFHWRLGLQAADTGSTAFPAVQVAVVAVAAPIMEEFVFRRCVLNRLLPYGEKAALLASALFFALFHRSVNQGCDAVLLGLVFGYVYLKTGKLRYSAALHILINTLSSAVLPALLTLATKAVPHLVLQEVELAEVITKPAVFGLLLYVALLLSLSLFGAVVFFFGIRERDISSDGVRTKTALSAWGVLTFVAVSLAIILVL